MLTPHVTAPAQPDLAAVKRRQHAAWSSGDYAVIGTTLAITGELLCEAVELRAGQRVLDIAAGNGNGSLAAARRWADVTSTDYVPALLERGRERAAAERLSVRFQEADAEQLPVRRRVVRRGAVGVRRDVHPRPGAGGPGAAAGVPSRRPHRPGKLDAGRLYRPSLSHHRQVRAAARRRQVAVAVGTEQRLGELFGTGIVAYKINRRTFVFRYRSAEHMLAVFRTYYGPMLKAFGALDADGQAGLARDLTALMERSNVGGPNTLAVPSEYLEVVALRR